jgi:hypothetical protein
VALEDCPTGAPKDREIPAAAMAVQEPRQPKEDDRRHLTEDPELQGMSKASERGFHAPHPRA